MQEATALPFDETEATTSPETGEYLNLSNHEIGNNALVELYKSSVVKANALSQEQPNSYQHRQVDRFLEDLKSFSIGKSESIDANYGDTAINSDKQFFDWLSNQQISGFKITVTQKDSTIYETDGRTPIDKIRGKTETFAVQVKKI